MAMAVAAAIMEAITTEVTVATMVTMVTVVITVITIMGAAYGAIDQIAPL
ncbi:hypothetical protein [Telmatospirillum siberiense]|nr:hypothetical protein [Telmatospirillum siberiense]